MLPRAFEHLCISPAIAFSIVCIFGYQRPLGAIDTLSLSFFLFLFHSRRPRNPEPSSQPAISTHGPLLFTKRPINVCGRSSPVHSSRGPDSAPIFVLYFSRVSASLTAILSQNSTSIVRRWWIRFDSSSYRGRTLLIVRLRQNFFCCFFFFFFFFFTLKNCKVMNLFLSSVYYDFNVLFLRFEFNPGDK